MKNKKVRQIGILFVMMLLLNMAFVPAVSCETDSESLFQDVTVEKVESPDVEIIKMNNTSSIVQVGDIVISMDSDPAYTEARMTINDQNTGETADIDYKVFEVDGGFETEVYFDGELYTTLITEYNPIKPIERNPEFKEMSLQYTTSEVALEATPFQWDGVTFVQGRGIKYPHPDRDYYGIETWDDYCITGNNLYHCQIDESNSATYSYLSPVIVGGLIGVKLTACGNPAVASVGGVVGSILALIMGNDSAALLLDEEGCIWYWYGQESFWKPFPSSYVSASAASIIPPSPIVLQVPVYARISEYTLWNNIGLSNPGADDWNPWNDVDSLDGRYITTAELQEAVYCWVRIVPAPTTGAEVSTSRILATAHFYANHFEMGDGEEQANYRMMSVSSQITANRTISSFNVTPNSTFTVTVDIETDYNVTGLALDENYPLLDGTAVNLTNETFRFWSTTVVEDDHSTFKYWTHDFIWSSNIAGEENLTVIYNATVPSNLTGGMYNISGNVSAYGINDIEVGGDTEVYVMDDWNPWNDWDSGNGRYITLNEVISAYNCHLNSVSAPRTGACISIDNVIDMYNAHISGTPM
ncbi:hypothetical protein [uncultured Methanolobus sp.]|uniref:hypothetical protein n=1 Tax=uncultured Methanolobus sp. TaxID=218300 RepID=UPI002AAB62A6|nr:hypothetical protein [uncultured Methanolobus sp.]